MTQPAAAQTEIVPAARMSVSALLELHRFAKTCLSSWAHATREENHDATTTSDTAERTLRADSEESDATTAEGSPGAAQAKPGAVAAIAGKGTRQGVRL